MAVLFVTAPIGAVGAGADSGRITIATPFDSQQRRVTGVKCSNTAKARNVIVDSNGAPQVTVDLGILGQLSQFLECDFIVPTNIQFSFTVKDTGAGALAAGDFVTLRYEV